MGKNRSREVQSFKVHHALLDDIDSGQVWLTRQPAIRERSIARIISNTGKTLYCQVLVIDPRYQALYNQGRCEDPIDYVHFEDGLAVSNGNAPQAIVLSRSYRDRLGQLETGQVYSLRVDARRPNSVIAQCRAALDDPNPGSSLGVKLSLLTFIAGAIIGILITLFVPHIA